MLLGGFHILLWNLGNEEKRERNTRLCVATKFYFFLSFFTFLSSAGYPSPPAAEENQGWAGPLWSKHNQQTVVKKRLKIDHYCHPDQDQPAVPHVLECLGGAVVFLDHEVSSSNCGTATVSHVAAGP